MWSIVLISLFVTSLLQVNELQTPQP